MDIIAPVGMCLGAIVVAAAAYFIVTFIKGKLTERRERRACEQIQRNRPRR